MTDNVIQFPLVTPADRRLCDRAAAHSVGEIGRLNLEACFRGGITDLDVARVILAVERGSDIRQGGEARWMLVGREKMNRNFLSCVVDEMLRTGLAMALSERVRHEVVAVHIRVAPVHFRALSDDLRPSCHTRVPLRVRRTERRDLVDCVSCLNIRP